MRKIKPPTPAQIRERAAQVRAKWSKATEAARRVIPQRAWQPPDIQREEIAVPASTG